MNIWQEQLQRKLEPHCIPLYRAQIWTCGSPGYAPCLQHEFREQEPGQWQWRLHDRQWRNCSAECVERHLEFAERAGFSVRWRVLWLASVEILTE